MGEEGAIPPYPAQVAPGKPVMAATLLDLLPAPLEWAQKGQKCACWVALPSLCGPQLPFACDGTAYLQVPDAVSPSLVNNPRVRSLHLQALGPGPTVLLRVKQ